MSISASVITLDRISSNAGFGRHFVNMSVIISDVGTYDKRIVPFSLWYRITWCLISICFVLDEASLFSLSLMVASLSSLISIGVSTSIPISRNTMTIQISSLRASDNARYSASELDWDGTDWVVNLENLVDKVSEWGNEGTGEQSNDHC